MFDEVRKWWNIFVSGMAMFRVAKRLREVKNKVRKWKKETFGNSFWYQI